MYFDGAKAKGEDGSSFGIIPEIYELLAGCSVCLAQVAGVEPVCTDPTNDVPCRIGPKPVKLFSSKKPATNR
jgi:hypothetical protein